MKYVVYSIVYKTHHVDICGISDNLSEAKSCLHDAYSQYTSNHNMEVRVESEDRIAIYKKGYVYNTPFLYYSIASFGSSTGLLKTPVNIDFGVSNTITSSSSIPPPPPQDYMEELKNILKKISEGENVLTPHTKDESEESSSEEESETESEDSEEESETDSESEDSEEESVSDTDSESEEE